MNTPKQWPGPAHPDCEPLEPSGNIKCSREDCGAVAYRIDKSLNPVVIECGMCLKRGGNGRCVERCPNGYARGDDLAAVEAEWQAKFQEVEG